MATKTNDTIITIQKPKLTRLNIRIVGDTPLLRLFTITHIGQ